MNSLRKVGRQIRLPLQIRRVSRQDEKEWDFQYVADTNSFRHVPSNSKTVKIDDLSSKDREKIRQMAETEYYRLATIYGIQRKLQDLLKQQTVKLGSNVMEIFGSDSVFGVQLTTLLARDQKIVPYCRIPLAMKMIFEILDRKGYDDKGIISVPASDFAAVNDVKAMMDKDFYGNQEAIKQKLLAASSKVTGDILKFVIRHIPNTLFTSDYADAFYQLGKITDEMDQLKAMKMLIFQLPDVNCNVLADLLSCLQKIAGGKMKKEPIVKSLSFIMTPALFEMPETDNKDAKQVGASAAPYSLTQLMINCADILFVVPPFMLNLLELKHLNAAREKQVSAPVGELRITAPEFNLINYKLAVTPSTTANDVLKQFCNRIKSKVTPPELLTKESIQLCLMKPDNQKRFVLNHCMCEAGGKVSGERKLHKDTKITAAMQENPKAKWFIRCTHKR